MMEEFQVLPLFAFTFNIQHPLQQQICGMPEVNIADLLTNTQSSVMAARHVHEQRAMCWHGKRQYGN